MKATEETKTSYYLVQRAEALAGALRFFFAGVHDRPERLLQFLAQIDYWDWEVENLIYSFVSFDQRSKAWESSEAAAGQVGRLGIALDAKWVRKVRWRNSWETSGGRRRVVPVDLLKEVVRLWNDLLDAVEQRGVEPMRQRTEQFNLQTLSSLQAFKKRLPAPYNEDDADTPL